MSKKILTLLASLLFLGFSCGPDTPDVPDQPDQPGTPDQPVTVTTPAFARGADISWVSEMEKTSSFKKKDGTAADIFAVLKDCGINSIRLRVWVNPTGGYSGKDDLVALAQRAAAAGMSLMVDFHYSDFFADPTRQTIPAAWNADASNLPKMKEHVQAHTREVLEALKAKGITPAWIQIGNETRNGMLWPAGQLWTAAGDIPGGWSNFVGLYNAGYDAAKAVFPSALVMPHLNNAYEDNDWWFAKFKQSGGKMDMIALSHYPQAETAKTPTEYNNLAISNIRALQSKYDVPVMVSEVGVKLLRWDGQKAVSIEAESAALLKSFVVTLLGTSGCKGVFYWEPEVYGGWKPAVYSTLNWAAYDQGAFDDNGSPSAVMDAFK